jgi:hypothetical protein
MFKKNNNRYLIKTPTGFEHFEGIKKKIADSLFTFIFEDDTYVKCSGNHVFLTDVGFLKACEIVLSNTLTNKIIKNISSELGEFEVYDPVCVEKHSTYFSNGVISHNTYFLGSSNTLISGKKLQQMVFAEPIAEHDKTVIYEYPVKGDDDNIKDHLYCIVVDVSEGRNMDSSAFSVIDISSTPYKQVATYQNANISPILFPTIIHNAARMYNDAYILVEINNNPQVADVIHQDLEYENLFKIFTGNKKPQQLSAGFGRGVQMGLKMSPAVKRIGCSNLKTLIEGDKLIVNDFNTISELTTFVANKTSFAAESDSNDDLAMTLVIFGWLSTQKYFKDIVSHDIRKQIQLENMNQLDDENLPAPIIEDGRGHSFEVIDGDVWETTSNGDVYSGFFKELMRSM